MTYKELLAKIADTTGMNKLDVRNVLFCIPDLLIGLAENETVRTPLGTFRMIKRKSRVVKPPKGSVTTVPAGLVVKLKVSAKLKRAI